MRRPGTSCCPLRPASRCGCQRLDSPTVVLGLRRACALVTNRPLMADRKRASRLVDRVPLDERRPPLAPLERDPRATIFSFLDGMVAVNDDVTTSWYGRGDPFALYRSNHREQGGTGTGITPTGRRSVGVCPISAVPVSGSRRWLLQ